MKAAIVPAVDSNWEIKEVPTPSPGVNPVLIEIHPSGLCYTDVYQDGGQTIGKAILEIVK